LYQSKLIITLFSKEADFFLKNKVIISKVTKLDREKPVVEITFGVEVLVEFIDLGVIT